MGASGRIGKVLRAHWPDGAARWQARGALAGCVRLDPLADPGALAAAAAGCDTILCLAGVVPGRGGSFEDNVALGLAAVRAGAEARARVLLASSAAVYGRAPGLLGEDAAPAPETDYGRAKVAMEAEAAALGARLGVAVTSLRLGNIAGVDAILGGWRPGFELDRFADGRTPRRSYIGLATLVRALLALCDGPPLPGVLNVAAPGVLEMGALLDAAGLAWAPRAPGPEAIPEVALDVAALEGFFPLSPRDSLAETVVAEWRALGTTLSGTDTRP